MQFGKLALLALTYALTMNACQSTAPTSFAVLQSADGQTMSVVKSVLARAMNRAQIEIGPGDLTQTSTVSVLPPRLNSNEDRSTVAPTLFDIMLKGSVCFVIRRDTAEEFELTGVACRPLSG